MIADKIALYILPEMHTYSAQELVYAERADLRSSRKFQTDALKCMQEDRVRCTVTCACIRACAHT